MVSGLSAYRLSHRGPQGNPKSDRELETKMKDEVKSLRFTDIKSEWVIKKKKINYKPGSGFQKALPRPNPKFKSG